MAGLRDADAGARQVGFEDGRRGVSRSVGHRPGIQHQGSAATRKSRAVAAPRSARFPREQLSVQVQGLDIFGVLGLFRFCRILPKSEFAKGDSRGVYATYVQAKTGGSRYGHHPFVSYPAHSRPATSYCRVPGAQRPTPRRSHRPNRSSRSRRGHASGR